MIKISIITPTYNCADMILETYSSIVEQSYGNWEWVVTDDCSSDNTYEILKTISQSDSRVIIRRNTVNSGAAVTRNMSIERSSGVYLAFIDSDDLWVKDKLLTQIEFMETNDIDFSFTAYEMINKDGGRLNKFVDLNQSKPLTYANMLKKKATLGCSTVMLRKCAFSDLSMPLLRTGQDYALWLKLLKSGTVAYPLNKPLTRYRIVPGSISRNKFKKAQRQWEIYRKLENLNLLSSAFCFCFYAWRAVFRK